MSFELFRTDKIKYTPWVSSFIRFYLILQLISITRHFPRSGFQIDASQMAHSANKIKVEGNLVDQRPSSITLVWKLHRFQTGFKFCNLAFSSSTGWLDWICFFIFLLFTNRWLQYVHLILNLSLWARIWAFMVSMMAVTHQISESTVCRLRIMKTSLCKIAYI